MEKRIEKDFLGSKEIENNALYGINSVRAIENFGDRTSFHKEWFQALGLTKQACYETYKRYKFALKKKLSAEELKKIPFSFIADDIIEKIIEAANEIASGEHYEHFIVPAISGGAGTSINMNINEIVANLTLLKLGDKTGNYEKVHPIDQANIYQSTNDVIPSSLKVAVIKLLTKLEKDINENRLQIEALEKKHRNDLRIAYTQLQQAVPSSFGKFFSTFNQALSRDWWRISKCFERIKVINLGGSAIGTGITVPKFFIMEVVTSLRELTKLPITRSENLQDATANLDSLVEVHAILKSHAVNLEKIVADLRLLSSDLVDSEEKELSIPAKQLGSSIMPGKVNPVICEYVISVSHKIYANDLLISNLCGQGQLDLNAYLPTIGHALLESLKLLISANKTIKENLIKGLEINTAKAEQRLYRSSAITTALVPMIGYEKAALLAKEMKRNRVDIFEANNILKLISTEKIQKILKKDNLLKTGFTMSDLL